MAEKYIYFIILQNIYRKGFLLTSLNALASAASLTIVGLRTNVSTSVGLV